VWRQRVNLYREYWRDKVPTCLKGKPEVLDKCVNPFHYLTLVNPTKASSLGTCNCSAQIKVKKNKRKLPEGKGNMKIDNWLVKVRVVEEKKSIKIRNKTAVTDGTDELDYNDLSGLDHKHLPASTIPLDSQKDKHLRIRTSGQIVLEEQDRKKRLKLLS
jgi:hypothetical protein